MAEFQLHPRLEQDCFAVCEMPVCKVLLMNDARYAWCILVPREPDLKDLHDVPRELREALFDEIEQVSEALQSLGNADKINVAALGNQVPQLHVHVIARRVDDPAWPGPVWGVGEEEPYGKAAELRIEELRGILAG